MSTDASLEKALAASLACAQTAAENHLYDEAAALCRSVLDLAPEQAGALALLGTVRGQQGHVGEAIDLLERAIRQNQGEPVWYANLCALYRAAERPAEAMSAAFAAVALDSTRPQLLVNLALCCHDADRFDEAEACVLRAISLDPDDAAPHLVLAQLLLARGQWRAGLMEYEWRVRIPGQASAHMNTAAWNGMRLNGVLLLVTDQGFGDALQFSRYIALAAERCHAVHLFCSAELAPVLRMLPGVDRCFTAAADLQPHLAHARLSSLPWLFGTDLSSIPASSAFPVDPVHATRWQHRLAAEMPAGVLRVGLNWAGSTSNINDGRRSLTLDRLAPLLEVTGDAVRFVSLQRPVRNLGTFAAMPANILDYGQDLGDFSDGAALIDQLDLIITVDTAVAHLAAGLGKPTWVLLSKAADWRWLLDRDDTPWYPTIRLFRQQVSGAWNEPIAAAAAALTCWIGDHRFSRDLRCGPDLRGQRTDAERVVLAAPGYTASGDAR